VGIGRKLLFSSFALLIMTMGIELLCFGFCMLQKDDYTWFEPQKYVIDDETIERRLSPYFHPTLGWKKPYETPFGERPREIDYPEAILATFGDSYTHCDQVENDETWQTYLSRTVGADVYNFGGGGYGTGQALLRFREDYPEVGTPWVGLGLITENINRIVNRYRKFYYHKTGIPMTKPRFLLEGGELTLIENPIRERGGLARLKDPAFLKQVGEHDVWYDRNDYPRLAFPYSRILFNRSFWLEVYHGKLGDRINDVDPRPWADLWSEDDARKLMFALFDRFVAEAREMGARPVILLLPMQHEVLHRAETGRSPGDAQWILAHGRERGYDVFDGIAALAAEAGDTREIETFFDHHLTAKGNEVLARRLHRFLADLGAFDRAEPGR
jgi:hypothetical protein